ncbi:hypothetical protein [Aeromonas phage SW69-9]|nr:hypothetical protein [Aeromonas phage SW69-9]
MKKFEHAGKTYEVDDEFTNYAVDADGELWVYSERPSTNVSDRNDYFDAPNSIRQLVDKTSGGLEGPYEIADDSIVTVKVPPELKGFFISMMSCCLEQTLMECYAGHDSQIPGTGLTFEYPHFARCRGEKPDEKCDIVMRLYDNDES